MLLTKKNMNISVHGMSLYILDIKHNLNMYNRKGNIQNSLIDSYSLKLLYWIICIRIFVKNFKHVCS